MLPWKKILCPIDFSEASLESLKTACELAAQFSSELLLVHVRPISVLPPEVMGMPGFDYAEYERQRTDNVHTKLEDLAPRVVPKGIACRLLHKEGDAGHQILEAATAEGVDLIVIATHGMTGWRHYLYGSVTQRVLQNTPCSCMVIRAKAPRQR